jgi:hypothetical protein
MKKQTNLPAGSRKLSLNKKTISNLSASEMSRHVGGSTGCYPHYPQKTKNGNTCYGHATCYNC